MKIGKRKEGTRHEDGCYDYVQFCEDMSLKPDNVAPYHYINIVMQIRILKKWMIHVLGQETATLTVEDTWPLPAPELRPLTRDRLLPTSMRKQIYDWWYEMSYWREIYNMPDLTYMGVTMTLFYLVLDKSTLKELITLCERLKSLTLRQAFCVQIVLYGFLEGVSVDDIRRFFERRVCPVRIPSERFGHRITRLLPPEIMEKRWSVFLRVAEMSMKLCHTFHVESFIDLEFLMDEDRLYGHLAPLLEELSQCLLAVYIGGFLGAYGTNCDSWYRFENGVTTSCSEEYIRKKYCIVTFESWLRVVYDINFAKADIPRGSPIIFTDGHIKRILKDWNVPFDSDASTPSLRNIYARAHSARQQVPIYYFNGFTLGPRLKWKSSGSARSVFMRS